MSTKLTTASHNPNLENQPHCENGASSIIINKCTNKIRPNLDCLRKCNLNIKEPNVFASRKQTVKHILQGDLYVIGRLWIDTMKSVLLGTKSNFPSMPVVEAADNAKEHERPKAMKYTELPLDGELHSAYKDFEDAKQNCKDLNKKLLHSFLLPYVCSVRKRAQEICCIFKKEMHDSKDEVSEFFGEKKNYLVEYFRNPNNLNQRYAAVFSGGATGFMYAYRKGLPSKAFYTIAGLLAAGALCFPKETDEYFKDSLYYSANGAIALYNWYSGDNYKLPEKLPCKERDDSKKPFPPLRSNLCDTDVKKK